MTVVKERLPPGAAAALLNRAHTHPDLVLFVDEHQLGVFDSIDGHRTLAEIGRDSGDLFEQLWWHDLVAFDASGARR